MANILSWLTLFGSLRIFLTAGASSLSPECNIDCQTHCLIDCRQGYYYAAGNCLECPTGFYCPGGQAAPRKCPVGTANELTAQANITACKVCPNGYLSLESGAGCSACPDGYSCDPHRGVKQSCSPGHYSPEGELDCRECPEGYVCPDGQNRQYCLAGQEPNPSRTRCVSCALGSFSTGDAPICRPCPPGHYCPHVGTVQPLPCPPGSCTTALGQSECQGCSGSSCCSGAVALVGKERDPSGSPGVPQCQHCPSGHFCAEAPTNPPCPAGSFRPREGLRTRSSSLSCLPGIGLCLKCPAGYFCPAGASYPMPCPPGTYNPLQGQDEATDCRACLAGTACTQSGLAQPDSECEPGYVCPVGSSSPHSPSNACPPGTVGNQFNLFDKSQCEICPAGFVCVRGTGGRQKPPTPCPVGHYCPPGTKHPMQHKCGPGTWSNRTGLASKEECLPCPAGWFCGGGARVPSGRCSSGHYCPQGTWRGTQHPCPAGTYSTRLGNVRVEDCTACPAGTFCTSGTSKPILCPVGTYCMARGAKLAAECLLCPGGHYCPELGTVTPRACSAGNFSGRGQSVCGDCPEGMFCNETGLAEPRVCPKGHFCLPGSTLPLPCPVGTYTDVAGAGSCKPCPAGMYCSVAGLIEPEGPCQPGYYCVQGSSSSSPVGLPFGDFCPPGHYCPAGTTQPKEMPCPVGTWNEQRGGQDVTWCLPCTPGFFCNMSGQDAPVGLCARGYYCTGRAKTAKPEDGVTGGVCPRGHFCPPGSAAPSPCPTGEYSNTTGQDKCFPCPPGFHCPNGLRRRCPPGFYCPRKTGNNFHPCPPGTYNPSHGLSQAERCQQCPAGMFCGDWGLSSPSGPCWPGFFCTAGASVPNPNGATNTSAGGPCPPGHFCPAGTSVPQPCPAGTYSHRLNAWQDSSCTVCPPGSYCSSTGLAAPSGPCLAGYYCLSGATSPSPAGAWERGGPCPVSHFCPEGTSFPLSCRAGTYNNLTRQAACFPCAAGYYCPENATSYTTYPCPAGFYCPMGTKFATEFPCPRGYYNPDAMTQSLDSCLPCPPGHYCGKENLTSVSGKCDAGWFCVSAAWTSQPFDLDNYTNANCLCPATATGGKCLAGSYCPKGSPEPLPCPPGLYCNASGLSVPSGQCVAGFYCKGGAVLPQPTDGATGNICPVGTFCPAGSAVPEPCPAGTFSSVPGQRMLSECQPCPSGFFCKTPGLSAPTGECQEGYYCDSQQEPVIDFTLYPCPQGFYCPAGTYRSTQHSCPAGTFGPRQKLKTIKECQRCPPGKYCEFSGLAAPTGDCAEGFWCKSGAQVRNPQDGESGQPCPPGYYCPEGAPLPIQCPPGTWSDSEGGKNLQECQPCPGGYYCNSSGLTTPSGRCSPGYYCVARAHTPTPTDGVSGAPCPIGHFCPLGSRSPAPCPSGSYMPQAHGEECLACPEGEYCVPGEEPQPCPQGFYCPRGTGLDWQPCPPGTYSPEQGQGSRTSCRACDGGKFCQYPNATAVTGECWEGYYCAQGSYKPNPDAVRPGQAGPCPAGHYCPRGTSLPTPCPVGTFSTRSRLSSETECSLCLPGHYCDAAGLPAPTGQCEEGFYCTLGSILPRISLADQTGGPCPKGHFCPKGTAIPVPCPAGSYNPSQRQASCLPCAQGFFCPENSSSFLENECLAGHYCPVGTASATQFPCPKGTYNPQTRSSLMSHCIPCDPGMYCSTPGLSQPSGFCHSGYHCTKGATSPAPFRHRVESAVLGLPGNDICPAGHFCPTGTGYPIPCPPGSFSTSVGLEAEEQCQPCPAGRYCGEAGLSSLAQTSPCKAGFVCLEGNSAPCPLDRIHGYRCPSGFYCPAGTGLELPCEPGTYSPMPGAGACLPCPAGTTCSSVATVKPLRCPRGYYCPLRTAAPLPCPEGTLNALEGALSPAACKLCPVGRYCSGDANWEADGLCSPGYYCEGGSTDAIPRRTPGFPLSGPCPLGHYCPEGTHGPVACPVGTLNNATGGTSPESCVPCYPGSFCASTGLSSPTGLCAEGFYCPANFSSFSPTAFLCPKGHFCRSGAAHPVPCPAGEYQPTRGSASCIPCRRGFYCQEAVAGDPKRCPPHTYCPTGTRVPHSCPEGTFTMSNMTGLWNEKECLTCLPGHYCRRGRLEGLCAAGYFCLAGSSRATPQGHVFSWRFLSECRWGKICAGLCPAGFYCQEGSEVPIPCPANTLRSIPGAKRREDCLPCPPGRWCKAGESEAHLCPSGHYCFGGNGTDGSPAPQKCPPHTYRKDPGAQSAADCQPCPPGYHCPFSGLTNFEDYPCPLGYWCPGKGDAFLCPPGTSRIQPGAASLEDCDPCPSGYYCPDPAQTGLPNTQGVPCKPGYECPPGSVSPVPCRRGSYCAVGTAVPSTCPGGYFCPEGSSTYNSLEQLCVFPYYCPPGSAHPLVCAGGYMALNLPGPRDSLEKFCRICDAGTYRNDSLIAAPCQPCPAGFICPQGSESYQPQPCPRGYYCPALVPAPVACPPGTHGSSSFAKRVEECQACPAGSFNHLPAQPACFPCGSSSSSPPGAASCTCHGLNRAFQQSDASCICRAGYVYYDERGKKNPDSNSDQDCQLQMDELCAPGEVRLASTRQCVSPERYDCSAACGPAGGEINAELGICHCKQYVSTEELCDQVCLLRAPQVSLRFGINKELLLRMREGEERELTDVLGPDEHVQKSQRVHLVLFSPSGVQGFIVSSADVLDAFLTGDFSSDTFLTEGPQSRKASSKDIHALPLVPNPIVCLETGDTVLFHLSINPHDRAASHYPVYQKLHLYNSNPGWDFGPFRRLDHLIQETRLNISWFAHVFLDSGTYVFRDRTIEEYFLIVTVKEAHVGCDPRGVSFQPSSPFQLARHGILKHQELNVAPNWAAITAVLFVLAFLIVVLMTLAIVLQPPVPPVSPLKSWKPRWRSLGEPHVPPEYVVLKDSLHFYQTFGPCGSGEEAVFGEKRAAQHAERSTLRDLEDFSVRTVYDKLEDQNLHLASQLAKQRMDVLVFYKGVRQQIQGLMDMVKALDSESLNNLAKQKACGCRASGSLSTEKHDELSSNNFEAVMNTGAPWQEATELMKALTILLRRVEHKNAPVEQEVGQQVPGQDIVAEFIQTSEGKAELVDEQMNVAKLEEMLDKLNEEFLELTVQALRSQEEGELLEQELRMHMESTVIPSINHACRAQCFPELLDSWATKRDEAQLLEKQRSCVAQRIEEIEAELLCLDICQS